MGIQTGGEDGEIKEMPKTGTVANNPETEAHEEDTPQETDGETSCTVTRLWEDSTNRDRIVWLTEPPIVEKKDQAASDFPRPAITLLHTDPGQTGKHALDTIIMRGTQLRRFLEDTIPDMSSFYNEAEQGIAIKAPFRLLFWHLDQIEAAAHCPDRKSLSRVTTLVLDVLQDEFRDLLAKRARLVAEREMNFDVLWTVFKPGITCLTKADEHTVAVKVSSIHFSKDPMGQIYYRIKHDTLAWDGLHFGWDDSYTDIYEFRGRRKILDLSIYPIEYHPDKKSLVDGLVARGKKFARIAMKEPHMMSFNGEALDRESSPMWWQGEQKKKMSERIVLDARAYNHYFRRYSVSKLMKRDAMADALLNSDAIFLYCQPEFRCFALQHKKWARAWIDDLEEVEFNDLAYPSLFLPHDYKELLLAFAEAQIDGYGFDDIIAGKGQGILMLLAGAPGTGKTLTAEAMAEHMQRPLYSVSAGELGTSAGGMENELDRVLELSTRWNAVLLLDEADVFLERRTDSDIRRNSIVSVFLRKLEYYRGIMFLTTNRIHAIDEAFKSRIHIAIRYPDLDASTRRSIWQNHLKRAADFYQHGVNVGPQELDQLSQKTLNGREIRNIVKSAQLLASRSKQPLQKSHLDIVWRVEHEQSAFLEYHPSAQLNGVDAGVG
ncbi:uncharacterized protein HMPREF1541_08293 [Cyphellophora europaea CBS 101466]|uniref:AAA+ ATPase domain-containing protein n=1 Tax=Cyphellophora europaea (strain CBS 101466) TaxID=1220924 RepID=W2RLE5_CYPE1|nr:uncharacterized protein HMPREF1541_08293 [Cyphellophora europaea CBS 101466]ETN37302.1 hypothetical protein HMPREF1541_08293 [Cyphellophora europaea CBS 101466]